jgi:hypothetical protein
MRWLSSFLSRPVPYRNLVFFRAAIALTYLWVAGDFFVIARLRATDRAFASLLPPPSFETFFPSHPHWNQWLGRQLDYLANPDVFCWLLLGSIFLAVGFALGRCPRICQVGLSLMMILCGAEAPLFQSSADSWLFWTIFLGIWAPADTPVTRSGWRANPTVPSRYAALAVFLSFTVYFFAGCSKIAIGGDQWLGGTALQNIAFDPAMRGVFRGLTAPYWISAILCYYTLFQRLIIPFFFFLGRGWQIASILILGSMHVIYAILMHVSIFPAMGLACLILVPTSSLPAASGIPSSAWTRLWAIPGLAALALMAVMPTLQVAEKCSRSCAYLSHEIPRWSFAFYYPLRWEMFASGGARSHDQWRFLITRNKTEVIDITDRIDRHLPGTWRTRFYRDSLDRDAYALSLAPGTPTKRLDFSFQLYLLASQDIYLEEGGPKSLYITDSHIVFDNGDKKTFHHPKP